VAPSPPDLARDPPGTFRVDVEEGHPAPGAREAPRDRHADPRRGAGDDDRAVSHR
jgi:hypothetical protein